MPDTTDLNSTTVVRAPTDLASRTDVREPTDVHRTKIRPDDPRLRIERPRSRTLRKGPALIALGAIVGLGTIALAAAFSSSGGVADPKPSGEVPEVNALVVPLPSVIKDPPADESTAHDGNSSPDAARPATLLAAAASPPEVWANNVAGQINQAGQQLTQKSLQIQPTITVRPGFSVNVLVTKDIVIAPYARQEQRP
jgi:type IV secretory pathway VirB10-like protein